MEWNGVDYCDWCASPLIDEDKIRVRVPNKKGVLLPKHFHNRSRGDCMDKKLDELEKRFASLSLPAPSR